MQLFLSQPRYYGGYRMYGSPKAARQGYAALISAWRRGLIHVHPGSPRVWDRKRGRVT